MLSGPGFSELLRPDIVRPLLDTLQLEERLAPYLPEVHVFQSCCYSVYLWCHAFCAHLGLSLFLGVALFDVWHLAEQGVRTKQAIAELMQSPQFHQQLDAFTQVCACSLVSNLSYWDIRLSSWSTQLHMLLTTAISYFGAGDPKWPDRSIPVWHWFQSM